MNILILNGAPAGENSITLQTMRYIQKFFPEHHYEQLNVGQRIKAIERDFSNAGVMLEKAELVKVLDPSRPRTEVRKFEDDHGREFFSVNIVVGDEDGTYVRGGKIYSFAALNNYNGNRDKEAGLK